MAAAGPKHRDAYRFPPKDKTQEIKFDSNHEGFEHMMMFDLGLQGDASTTQSGISGSQLAFSVSFRKTCGRIVSPSYPKSREPHETQ